MALFKEMQFKVSHIYREGNRCVELLAAQGIKYQIDSWWDVMPFFSIDFFRDTSLTFYRFVLFSLLGLF